MKTGTELIQEERNKQIAKYGYTPGHDAGYKNKELLMGALSYLKRAIGDENCMIATTSTEDWPFDMKNFNDEGYVESLKKAGAFIAAELDRLQVN